MSQRQSQLLWMKDLIDHMSRCHEQLEWTREADSTRFLTDALIRDLSLCQRLCEELQVAPGARA